MNKKLLLSIGTIAAVAAPITAVVSCGSDDSSDSKESVAQNPAGTPGSTGTPGTSTHIEIGAVAHNDGIIENTINANQLQTFASNYKNGSATDTFTYDPLQSAVTGTSNVAGSRDADRGRAFFSAFASTTIENYDAQVNYAVIGNDMSVVGNTHVRPDNNNIVATWTSRLESVKTNEEKNADLMSKFSAEENKFIKEQIAANAPKADLSPEEFVELVQMYATTDANNKNTPDPRVMANEGSLNATRSTVAAATPNLVNFKLLESEADQLWRASVLPVDHVRSAFDDSLNNSEIELVKKALSNGNLRFVIGGKDEHGKVVIYPTIVKDAALSRIQTFEFWRYNDTNTGLEDEVLTLKSNAGAFDPSTPGGQGAFAEDYKLHTWGYNFLPGAAISSDYYTHDQDPTTTDFTAAPAWTGLIGDVLEAEDYYFGFAAAGSHTSIGPNKADGEWTRAWTFGYNLDDNTQASGLTRAWTGGNVPSLVDLVTNMGAVNSKAILSPEFIKSRTTVIA